MIKRQRHYSGWEIAGLVGSSVGLVYLVISPSFFVLGYFFDGWAVSRLNLLTISAGFVVALCLSLLVRQWFKPYPKYSVLACLGALAFFFAIIWTNYFVDSSLGFEIDTSLDLESAYTFEEMWPYILTEFIIISLVSSLIIWMNRPRWRKVTPSPVEAFE